LCARHAARPARKQPQRVTAKTRIKLEKGPGNHVSGIVSGDSWNDVAKGIEMIGNVLTMSPQQAKKELDRLQARRKR